MFLKANLQIWPNDRFCPRARADALPSKPETASQAHGKREEGKPVALDRENKLAR